MKPLAPNLFHFRFLWPYAFNAYYIQTPTEGIVVDASTRWDWLLIKSQLQHRVIGSITGPITGVVLTHAHPDHQGCAAKICRHFNVPLHCHAFDADSAEGRAPLVRQSPFWETIGNLVWAGPRSPVTRCLQEGDTIAGFTVYHLPGHTPGHLILLRESDRVAIVGDVINSNDYLMGFIPLLREPPRAFSFNPAQNRQSIRRLAALNPSLILTGHGPPIRNIPRFQKFAARL